MLNVAKPWFAIHCETPYDKSAKVAEINAALWNYQDGCWVLQLFKWQQYRNSIQLLEKNVHFISTFVFKDLAKNLETWNGRFYFLFDEITWMEIFFLFGIFQLLGFCACFWMLYLSQTGLARSRGFVDQRPEISNPRRNQRPATRDPEQPGQPGPARVTAPHVYCLGHQCTLPSNKHKVCNRLPLHIFHLMLGSAILLLSVHDQLN